MKKMTKWIAAALAVLLLAGTALAAQGQVKAQLNYRDIQITLDGEKIDPKDANGKSTEPFIIDGTTYLPDRAIAEALGLDVSWDDATNTVKLVSAGNVTVQGDKIAIVNDGVKITDKSFDKYFPGTTAKEAVTKLLAEGKVSVNGIVVPASEEGLVEYQVNGVKSLYKTEVGWGYNVHKTTSADNLHIAEARLGFFETNNTVRGHTTELTLDPATKQVVTINTNSLDVVRVADIIVYNESTTIARGEFELETQRVRPDVEKLIFNSAYFDQNVKVGDVAVYWFGPNGWELKKAVPVVGTVSKNDKNEFVVNAGKADEYVKIESNVSRYNLINSSRPTQFYKDAYVRMGLTDLDVITWCTDTGHPIGFTTGDNAKVALTRAIEVAKAAKDGVSVSETGEGVTGKWATKADMDAFNAAIAAAEAVLKNNLSSNGEKDMALYTLAGAYGTRDGKASGFMGALGGVVEEKPADKPAEEKPADKPQADNVKSWDNDNVKITDASFDSYFPGTTAKEAVAKLLAEGKCYVNGIKVPATAAETDDYQVNFVSSVYKTDAGWGYNVHKTTSANNLSFEAARLGVCETAPTVRGHKTSLTYNAACQVERIDTQSFDVFRIAYFEDHGGQVDKIMRGEFDLETNRVRFDVEKITAVNSENFDDAIQVGDVVVYYYGPNGWVMEKAVAKVGTVTKDNAAKVFTVTNKDGAYSKVESNVSRYNLINSARPTQFFNDTYVRMGLTDVEITMWCTPNGYPIGFTTGDRADAKAALLKAIANAEAAKTGVAVSAEGQYGADVAVGTKWVTQENMDAYNAAIKAAKDVAYNNAAELYEYDMALYNLALAHGTADGKASGFIGSQGEGTKA